MNEWHEAFSLAWDLMPWHGSLETVLLCTRKDYECYEWGEVLNGMLEFCPQEGRLRQEDITRKDPWYETSKSRQPTAFSGCLENTFRFNVLGEGADIEPRCQLSEEGNVWKCWTPWCQRDDRIREEHRPWRGRDQLSKSRIIWLTRCKTTTTHRGL